MNFDAAWHAFLENDARIEAPATLEHRVLQGVGVAHVTKPRRPSTLLTPLLAAAAALVAGLVVQRLGQDPRLTTLSSRALTSDAWVRLRSGVSAERPSLARERSPAAPLADDPPAGTITLEYPETLQIVRIRVPREALEPLGLVVLEPDAQAVVDVDVLIGEDGLPRDIRQVRSQQE
jgi:hypothetical protein